MVCLVSLMALYSVLAAFLFFLRFNEARQGFVLHDKLVALVPAIDLSMLTFGFTYAVIGAGILIAIRTPVLVLVLLQAYTLLILFRIFTLAVAPLEPPAGIIPLRDYFLRSSVYSGGDDLKDLFFSGHTATICLFLFGFRERSLKFAFGIGAALVGALLLLQHVHYTIDVVAAPAFAWLAIYLARRISASSLMGPAVLQMGEQGK